jgi:Ser/Thr protein kinase RdoA (MazF antagonist)
MSAFHFASLTPDLILDALGSVGLSLESGLTPLNSYENRVYQFLCEDKRRYVAKFYRPERWSQAQILEEHRLTQYLNDNDVNVAPPLLLGESTLHEHAGFLFAVWPSVGGRHLEPDNLEQLEMVGHQLGLWHSLSPAMPLLERGAYSHERFVAEPIMQLRKNIPWPRTLDGEFSQLLSTLSEALLPSLTEPCPYIPLHGDCHIGNILWRDGPMLVDLDDCLMGPAIQDLWMLLSGDEAEQRMQLDALLAGYEEFCEFDTRQLRLIEPLRTARMIHHLAWLNRRWPDPAFPRAFPWFAEEEFWLTQRQQLTQQIARLKAPPLALTPFY